jgi:hypothetical protein
MLSSIIAISIFFVSCAKPPSKETTEAIAALQKLQAATQVGVNYQTYGQLLIDAKAKVNDSVKSLPDGELKTEISGAMDSYADAATVWGRKIEGHSLYGDNSEPDKTLIAKYSIPVETSKYSGISSADPTKAMQIIWLRADIHLKQIDSILRPSGK